MIDATPTRRRVRLSTERVVVIPETDVADLLKRAADNDHEAWNDLVDRYTGLLWSVGRSYRLDSAAIGDVVQTTWLRLLEHLDRVREPDRLGGWLATTARRECLASLRRAGREVLDWDDASHDEVPDVAPAIDHHILLSERDSALWQCFEHLSGRCQALLRVLMAVDPASYAEISAALGLPVGSIGPTRMRCLRRLREIAAADSYTFDASTEEESR